MYTTSISSFHILFTWAETTPYATIILLLVSERLLQIVPALLHHSGFLTASVLTWNLNTILKSLLEVYYHVEKLAFFFFQSHIIWVLSLVINITRYSNVTSSYVEFLSRDIMSLFARQTNNVIQKAKAQASEPLISITLKQTGKPFSSSELTSTGRMLQQCRNLEMHSKPFQEGSPSGTWWKALGLKRIRDPKSMYFMQSCSKYSPIRQSKWLLV